MVLSGDVVLLAGENGTGKTSLTEAFEWALFGSIVRKERSKTRGEYQGSSWVRSVHADTDLETYAEITLLKDDQRHVVRRSLVGTLHRLRKFGNRGSHEDETVNPASSAILSNVNALRALQERHLVTRHAPGLKLLAGGAGTHPASP